MNIVYTVCFITKALLIKTAYIKNLPNGNHSVLSHAIIMILQIGSVKRSAAYHIEYMQSQRLLYDLSCYYTAVLYMNNNSVKRPPKSSYIGPWLVIQPYIGLWLVLQLYHISIIVSLSASKSVYICTCQHVVKGLIRSEYIKGAHVWELTAINFPCSPSIVTFIIYYANA